MTGGIRSSVKGYTMKRFNLGGATVPETKSSSLSEPRDADSADKKPRDGSSLQETSLGNGKVPCLPMLTSAAKDLREASNGKQTSEGLPQKRKFETSDLEELNEKFEYINGFAPAYRDHTPTDILLHPGDNGPPIPAHKLLLATRSKILNIPNTEGCSKAPTNQVDNITLPELNHEELKSLVDFLYNADLLEDQMNKHVFSLSVAATKYGIPYLGRFCVRHMHNSLSSANALDALEVADVCSYQALKDKVLDYIAMNMSDVDFSAQFEALALKNPKLSGQVSRASFKGKPRDGSSLQETSLGNGKVPCLPMLTSAAKDLREASNGKQTSEGLPQKRKFETSDLEELNEKFEYINGFAPAYRDHTPTDILLHPGDNGPPIPAHKLLLATRSKILNIPNTEGCSKAPTNQVDNITLPELNHEELKSLVDFLYNADLLEDQMNKHVFSLSVAATKYGIPYLGRFCVRHMHNSLSSANALDALEVADVCSYQALKDKVLDYIAMNMSDVDFSAQFEALALKNPKLSGQVSRASFKGEKKKPAINVKKNINSSRVTELFMKKRAAFRQDK